MMWKRTTGNDAPFSPYVKHLFFFVGATKTGYDAETRRCTKGGESYRAEGCNFPVQRDSYAPSICTPGYLSSSYLADHKFHGFLSPCHTPLPHRFCSPTSRGTLTLVLRIMFCY